MRVDPLPGSVSAARTLVAGALAVNVDGIGPETRMYELAVWDSLGQLSVILAVEESLRVRIRYESEFEMLTSIPGIAAYLSRHGGCPPVRS